MHQITQKNLEMFFGIIYPDSRQFGDQQLDNNSANLN